MTTYLTPRRPGRRSARVSKSEAPRNVAEVPEKLAVTSITNSDATAAAAGGTA